MTIVNGIGLIAFLEAVRGEFANRLQHQKARLLEVGNATQQALIRKLIQGVDDLATSEVRRRPANGLQLFEASTPREDREATQQATLASIHQVVAPLNGVAERLLAAGEIPSP